MFNVYNVLVREDEEKEKYNIENLIQFDKKVVKNGVRVEVVEPFKFWFDCSSSLVWKPQLPPPVLPAISPNLEGVITPNEINTNLDHKIRNQSSSILEKTEKDIPSISPLLKKYLKKDTLDYYDAKPSSTKIKWHSSFTNAKKMLRKGTNLSEKEPHMVKKLKERASCFVSSNCRGKWVILASSLINGCNLEDLWTKLSDKLRQGLFQNCNITFQTDPDRILIYTNFLSSTMVPKVFTSIREMVCKMSYVVYPYGQVLCWNGGDVIIM